MVSYTQTCTCTPGRLVLEHVCALARVQSALEVVGEALVTYPPDFHIVESRQSASRSKRQDKLYRHFVQLEAESKFRGCTSRRRVSTGTRGLANGIVKDRSSTEFQPSLPSRRIDAVLGSISRKNVLF